MAAPLDNQRFLPSGEEEGTAPEDRRFRPDIEGLRAVAIVLVVLFHAGVPGVSGGFIGVDVFFVISGFVITGLLLRERRASGRTGFVAFYARRARRILPAAALVIVVSLIASRFMVGASYARLIASDARWTVIFDANFHFANVYPNYLVNRPASPLQPFWSLAVEEQFYLVYPAFFVAMLIAARRRAPRATLAVGLVIIIVTSLALSIATSHLGELRAYDSSFTRAWELAIGSLVAVGTTWILSTIPKHVGLVMTWVGLACVGVASTTFSAKTIYPGVAALLPVVGAALVIAGGTVAPPWGVEAVLKHPPFQWVGRWSYSWYLWHWPVLVLVALSNQTTVNATSVTTNLGLVAFSLVLAIATYFLVENPSRHSKFLSRNASGSLVGAGLLVMSCVVFTFFY